MQRKKEKNRKRVLKRRQERLKDFRYTIPLWTREKANILIQNTERRLQQRLGLDARRAERERKKTVLELQKRGDHIPIELLTLIPNPDVERKREEERAQLDEEMEDQDQSDDGFITFEYTDDEEEDDDTELDPFRDLIDPNLYA